MNRVLRTLLFIAATISASMTVGCGGTSNTITKTTGWHAGTTSSAAVSCPARTPVAGTALAGKALAQQQPLVAASVQLYAAGIGGNGSAATALSTAVTTGLDGSFTIPGGYICPSAQTPVYLLSKGGKPGNSSSVPSLWMMTAIGPCGSIGTGSTFIVDEVTTVAAVWALAPFLSSGGNVGSSCTNVQGLDNAFATANSLANAATGTSPGAGNPSTAAIPTTKLNTLADALASCTSSGTACTTLLNAAAAGNAAPSNTLDAALNIAHSPAATLLQSMRWQRPTQFFLRRSPPPLLTGCSPTPSPAEACQRRQRSASRRREMCGWRATSTRCRSFRLRRAGLCQGHHRLWHQRVVRYGARCSGRRVDRQSADHLKPGHGQRDRTQLHGPGACQRIDWRRNQLSHRGGGSS